MEILRHHDVGQVLVDALGRRLDVADEVHHRTAGDRLHRIGNDRCRDAPRFAADALVFGLRLVDQVQHLVRRVAGLLGDVAQAAACVGQAVGGLLQLGHHAELGQRVVQLAGDQAELVKHLGRRAGGHLRGQAVEFVHLHALVLVVVVVDAHAVAASFCMIFWTFSSKVAFVKGFTM